MLRLTVAERWEADLLGGIDLSIPLRFGGPQPNAFGLPRATADVVVSTEDGGPVNCVTVTLNPHGNGTHTECAGHVFSGEIDVRAAAPHGLVPCCVVSVAPRGNQIQAGDLAGALESIPELFLRALVLRTGQRQPLRDHTGQGPPSLHPDGARELRRLGVEHLLIDQPSVDPEDDGGLVASHKIFFEGVTLGARRTITEMVCIPSSVADGLYMLSLHVPPFVLDAAPSRPVLFPVWAI
jgi:arylformamidase